VLLAIAVAVTFSAVSAAGILVLAAMAPRIDDRARDMAVEVLLAALVLGLVAGLGWRRDVGINGVGEWRRLGLLAVPLLIVLLPFLGGFRGVDAPTIGFLVVGYTINSIAEDGMFRGILPRILRPSGLAWVVVLSSLLFGLVHIGNLLSRPDQSVAITVAQAVGAFTEGIGFIALRLVNRSVIPVMVVHALGDLFLRLGGLPIVPVSVVQSILFLVLGLWLLRRYRAEIRADGWG
jgi:membrane protease YdiL (CAAX protease family)